LKLLHHHQDIFTSQQGFAATRWTHQTAVIWFQFETVSTLQNVKH